LHRVGRAPLLSQAAPPTFTWTPTSQIRQGVRTTRRCLRRPRCMSLPQTLPQTFARTPKVTPYLPTSRSDQTDGPVREWRSCMRTWRALWKGCEDDGNEQRRSSGRMKGALTMNCTCTEGVQSLADGHSGQATHSSESAAALVRISAVNHVMISAFNRPRRCTKRCTPIFHFNPIQPRTYMLSTEFLFCNEEKRGSTRAYLCSCPPPPRY
jgi:hypothetical protein